MQVRVKRLERDPAQVRVSNQPNRFSRLMSFDALPPVVQEAMLREKQVYWEVYNDGFELRWYEQWKGAWW
jgi:hypothetical protein